MRFMACGMLLFASGCVTETDFVGIKQPELERASRATLAEPSTRVTSDDSEIVVEDRRKFRVKGTATSEFLSTEAKRCWTALPVYPPNLPCTITQPNTYEISVERQRPDGAAWLAGLVGTAVVASIGSLVAANFVCLSDPNCQSGARTALITTDVVLGVSAVTLSVLTVIGFFVAVERGLNN